jgi:hypothetical protein
VTRSIFYGTPAYVGSTTGASQCSFWPVSPDTINWDPTKLIPIDLAKNPQAHRNGTITVAQIQNDDYVTNAYPGCNTIGPLWPDGATIGACWLESVYWAALGTANRPPRVPTIMQCRDYELTGIWYWDGTLANRRYRGFQANIIAEKGTQAQCQVWAAGTSLVPNQPPFTTAWINLPTCAHPVESGFTAIWTGVGAAKTGALFLDQVTIDHLLLAKPKVPPSLGL